MFISRLVRRSIFSVYVSSFLSIQLFLAAVCISVRFRELFLAYTHTSLYLGQGRQAAGAVFVEWSVEIGDDLT